MDSQIYSYPNIPNIVVTLILGEPRNIISAREGVIAKRYKNMYKMMNINQKEFINIYMNEGDMIVISYPPVVSKAKIKITNLDNKRSMEFDSEALPILYYYFGEFKVVDNGFSNL